MGLGDCLFWGKGEGVLPAVWGRDQTPGEQVRVNCGCHKYCSPSYQLFASQNMVSFYFQVSTSLGVGEAKWSLVTDELWVRVMCHQPAEHFSHFPMKGPPDISFSSSMGACVLLSAWVPERLISGTPCHLQEHAVWARNKPSFFWAWSWGLRVSAA